ncbi:MAG: DUF4382 domain-containing protein [Acidobacteriaceae bacterium]
MRYLHVLSGLAVCLAAIATAGCGSGANSANPLASSNAQSAPVFLAATDAPLPSVVSFQVTVNSVTISNNGNNSVDVLQGPQTVDFARFNGLKTLLDFNSIPAGTYNTATISLSNPVISYLNMNSSTPSAPPSIATLNDATLMSSSVTVKIPNGYTVSAGTAAALKMDFDLRQSLLTDSTGQLTGQVNPTIDITALTPNTPDSEIDEFYGTVISVNAAQNSFMIQGPHGRQYNVVLNQANTGSGVTPTEWDDQGDENANSQGANNGQVNLASLVPNQTIVDIAGQFQPNTQTFDATDVAIVSQHGYYAGGLITYVNPTAGPANTFQMYVRGTLPTGTGIQPGQIATVQMTGNEKFYVFRRHSPLLQFLFNSSLLVPGQDVSIGGPSTGAQNASSVSTDRVVLHLSGISGTVVPGSMDSSGNSFALVPDGATGYLLSEGNPAANPLRVYLTGKTEYKDGFANASDVAGSGNAVVRVVGLILQDPTTGKPILVGKYVDKTGSTDTNAH